ncbi:sensor histidine kinase [Enterococcus sp. LJL99]
MKKRQRVEYFLVILVMALLFLGSIGLTNHFFKKELLAQQEEYLEKKAQLFLNQTSTDLFLTKEVPTAVKKTAQNYSSDNQERITLLDNEGTIFYDSSNPTLTGSRKNRPEVKSILAGAAISSSLRKSPTLGKEMLYLTIPVEKDNQLIGMIRIAEETTQFAKSIQTFRRYLIFTLGILFLIITLFVLLLLRQKNEPLVTVLPVLKKIVKHPDETRSIIQQSHEWSELYETVNVLSRQMSETYLAYTSTEEQFHSLLDELMIGVFIIDSSGILQLVNPKMLEILEINEPLGGEKYLEFFKEPTLFRLIHQVMKDKNAVHQEIILENTSSKTVLDLSLRYFSTDATSYQVLGIAYDLTRVRQLETMQKDFVSNVSHELKTPVTSLLGFTETLLDGAKEDPETLTEFLTIMQKDAIRLQQLIQEILQLSNDGKNITYADQKIHLNRFILDILSSYQKTIDAKGLSIEIRGNTDLVFVSKYELLHPIIKNLIENAIQYASEKGTIIVTYKIEKELIISVQDDGIGISTNDQERIFERFYRVDKARSRHSGGTGLGLSIVQNYTELLAGTVSLESNLGLGSTFTVRIPDQSGNKTN